jgi:hypothetical protein
LPSRRSQLGAALFLSIPHVFVDKPVRDRSIERLCSSTLCESARTFGLDRSIDALFLSIEGLFVSNDVV